MCVPLEDPRSTANMANTNKTKPNHTQSDTSKSASLFEERGMTKARPPRHAKCVVVSPLGLLQRTAGRMISVLTTAHPIRSVGYSPTNETIIGDDTGFVK